MSKQWYLYKNGEQSGPYSQDQLRQQIETGAAGPADMVWTEGMAKWIQASQVQSLFPSASGPPPVTPAYQQSSQGAYAAGGAAKKGKGGLIASVVIIGVVLVIGGFLLWNFFGSNGADSYVGNWTGTIDGDEVYIRIANDGNVTLASVEYGEYYQMAYRTNQNNGIYDLQIYDEYFEDWETILEMELLGRDRLRVTDPWSGDTTDLESMSDRAFDNILSGLELIEW